MKCPPQSLSLRVAFVDADLVTPVFDVLVVVRRPHQLHLVVPVQLVHSGTTPSEAPLSGSCVSTGRAAVGVEPRRRLLGSTVHLHNWTVLVTYHVTYHVRLHQPIIDQQGLGLRGLVHKETHPVIPDLH